MAEAQHEQNVIIEPTYLRIERLYPEYIEMIRAFVSEGVIEVDEPTDKQVVWADRIPLGNPEFARAVSLLARVTEVAYKQRFLEGMPVLVDLTSAPSGLYNGFESVERLHFLRHFKHDWTVLQNIKAEGELTDVPPVLWVTPVE